MHHSVSFLFFMQISVHARHWNYHSLGPETWSDHYPLCAGQSQSPINIFTSCTHYKNIAPFSFVEAYDEEHTFTVKNNGQTIVGTIEDRHQPSSIHLTGGGLNGTFDFLNFHLHWGENHKSGSEHQVNGQKYAGEIHFVHINRQTGQLAVLGIFMDSYVKTHHIHLRQNQHTRDQWKEYISIAKKLKGENHSISYKLSLKSMLGENLDDFWRYEGSLTTPPCTEGVIWTVFKQPIVFTEELLQKLRENVLLRDYRTPQPMYHRIVYRNYRNETGSPIPDYNRCVANSIYAQSGGLSLLSNIIDSLLLSEFVWPLLLFLSIFIVGVVGSKVLFLMQKNKAD